MFLEILFTQLVVVFVSFLSPFSLNGKSVFFALTVRTPLFG